MGAESSRVVLYVTVWGDSAVPLHHRLMAVSATVWGLVPVLSFPKVDCVSRNLAELEGGLVVPVADNSALNNVGGGYGRPIIKAAACCECVLCALLFNRAVLAHFEGGGYGVRAGGGRVEECKVSGFVASCLG